MTTTTLRLHSRAEHHKVSRAQAMRINWKLIYFPVGLMALVLLVYYIFAVNQLTGGAYAIRNYNNQISSLSDQNATLQASFAQSDFLAGVTQKAQTLDFEKTTVITYVPILQSTLAER